MCIRDRSVLELSGGQKQILNLASIMAMQPSVLILDEPTSQLDPIAASEFLHCVSRINHELGTTVIITEHRLDEVLPLSDRVLVIENNGISAFDSPQKVGKILKEKKFSRHKLKKELPFSKQSIDDWFFGVRIPSLENLIILAKYFDCSMDYLVGREN